MLGEIIEGKATGDSAGHVRWLIVDRDEVSRITYHVIDDEICARIFRDLCQKLHSTIWNSYNHAFHLMNSLICTYYVATAWDITSTSPISVEPGYTVSSCGYQPQRGQGCCPALVSTRQSCKQPTAQNQPTTCIICARSDIQTARGDFRHVCLSSVSLYVDYREPPPAPIPS